MTSGTKNHSQLLIGGKGVEASGAPYEGIHPATQDVAATTPPPQVAHAPPPSPGGLLSGLVNRAPVGVLTCITSYNFPMVNMAGKVAPALAAGNTGVVKPAPQDPLAIVGLAALL